MFLFFYFNIFIDLGKFYRSNNPRCVYSKRTSRIQQSTLYQCAFKKYNRDVMLFLMRTLDQFDRDQSISMLYNTFQFTIILGITPKQKMEIFSII